MGYCFISKPQLTATNSLGLQMCGWGFKKPMKVKKNQIMLRSETLVIV
jgi:hypothetical protein